jgi:hypothetical protein
MCRLPHAAYGPCMKQIDRRREEAGSTRVFCATCGHSEFVHADSRNRRCLYSVCDCNCFVARAVPDLMAQVLPPSAPRPGRPEDWDAGVYRLRPRSSGPF